MQLNHSTLPIKIIIIKIPWKMNQSANRKRRWNFLTWTPFKSFFFFFFFYQVFHFAGIFYSNFIQIVLTGAGYSPCAPKVQDGQGLPRRWMHRPLHHSALHRSISLLQWPQCLLALHISRSTLLNRRLGEKSRNRKTA